MRKHLLFVAIACATLVSSVSCEKQSSNGLPCEFDAYVDKSKVEVGEILTFVDESTSVSSREWTFGYGANITSSNDASVEVSFSTEGPVECHLTVNFTDGSVEEKTFIIQVGDELFSRNIMGFENEEDVLKIWHSWGTEGTDLTLSVDNTQGALETPSCLKIEINKLNGEGQVFTKDCDPVPACNKILKPNKKYILSFYIKSNVETTVDMGYFNEVIGLQPWKQFAWYGNCVTTTKWEYRQIEFDVDDLKGNGYNGTADNSYIQFKFTNQATTYYLDEISLKVVE